MKNPESILVIVSILVALLSWVSSIFKSGYLAYSPWSLLSNNRLKYSVNKGQLRRFVASIGLALTLNVLFALAVTRSIALLIEFSLLNTFFISYSLMYWVLLKEKRQRR